MGDFIIVVSIVFFIGAWYFWKKKPNKKIMLGCLILGVIFVMLYGTTDDYKAQKKTDEAESSKVESSKKASSNRIASSKKASSSSAAASRSSSSQAIKNIKNDGISNDDQARKIIKEYSPNAEVKELSGSYADSKQMNITIKGRENATAKMTLRNFWQDTSEIWKSIKQSNDAKSFEKVTITVEFPLKDTAGNTSTEHVMRTSLSGNKVQKLNLKHFNYDNVPEYANYYWQSNAFPKMDE